ncbi:hypothetical protein D3C81_1952680 [compost metagenome]
MASALSLFSFSSSRAVDFRGRPINNLLTLLSISLTPSLDEGFAKELWILCLLCHLNIRLMKQMNYYFILPHPEKNNKECSLKRAFPSKKEYFDKIPLCIQ